MKPVDLPKNWVSILILLLGIVYTDAHAQSCPYYDQLVSQGETKFRQGDYQGAFNKYQVAIANCPSMMSEVWPKLLKVFQKVEELRKIAELAQDSLRKVVVRLDTAEAKLKMALREAVLRRDMAIYEKQVADSAITEMLIQQEKNEKLISAFYYYADKFALAYGDVSKQLRPVFYFIDQEGNFVQKLGTWEDAVQFNLNGFAKVTSTLGVSLIDTSGRQYRLAESVEDLGPETRAFNLDNHNLENLPKSLFTFEDLEVLLIGSNRLTSMPRQVERLSNLRILQLQQNKLAELPAEIGNLKSLQELNASNNVLASLPSEIGGLQELRSINLSDNVLKEIPNTIGMASNLKFMDLSWNKLTELPIQIGALSNLERLVLTENELRQLPSSVTQLSNLKTLQLRDNPIETFPLEVCKLPNLTYLDIGTAVPPGPLAPRNLEYFDYVIRRGSSIENGIEHLISESDSSYYYRAIEYDSIEYRHWTGADSFCTLRKALPHTTIQFVPDEIGLLRGLQHLNLSGNSIMNISGEIGYLKSLIDLDLAGNRLDSLPSQLGDLVSLKSLDLSHNQLQHLPSSLSNLKSLEKCALRFNQLAEVPESLYFLPNLKVLYLGHNPCADSPEEIQVIRDEFKRRIPGCSVRFY